MKETVRIYKDINRLNGALKRKELAIITCEKHIGNLIRLIAEEKQTRNNSNILLQQENWLKEAVNDLKIYIKDKEEFERKFLIRILKGFFFLVFK